MTISFLSRSKPEEPRDETPFSSARPSCGAAMRHLDGNCWRNIALDYQFVYARPMTLRSVCKRIFLALPLALWLGGCTPNGPEDEEKDPHYLTGQSRVGSMDYDGAIAAFENALIANPKSAAAHLELGLLNEEKKGNYAAAIYHFEKHLELRPQSNMAETVKQHIVTCKMELAKTVPWALVSRQVQDEIRKLTSSNSLLSDQVKQLKADLTEQAAYYSNKLALATRPPPAIAASNPIQVEPTHRPPSVEKTVQPVSSPTRATASRTYLVRSGDTLASIAKRHNIRLSALQTANPRVEARKLKAGQVLNIPGVQD